MMIHRFTDVKLTCFGGMVKPNHSVLLFNYKPTDEHEDPDWLNNLADIFFLRGPKEAVQAWYGKLIRQLNDAENKEWWVNDDESFAVGLYDLTNDEMLLTFLDQGSGAAMDATIAIPCPDGCTEVSVVHAHRERCLEEQPEFFEDIQHLFES